MNEYIVIAPNTRDTQDAIIEQMAACITQKEDLRIIIETGDAKHGYYMVDFSNCGTPFDDDTKVWITYGVGTDYDMNDEEQERYWKFTSYIQAREQIEEILAWGFLEAYVETF